MRIEISILNTRSATILIDGRQLEVKRAAFETKLEGVTSDETESSIGGMVASEVYRLVDKVFDAMKATGNVGTWDELPSQIAEETYMALN